MKITATIFIALSFLVLTSCEKSKTATTEIVKDGSDVRGTPAPKELLEGTSKFNTENEFISLKTKYLEMALSKLDLQKIDLRRNFIIKGKSVEKIIAGVGYNCKFEVRDDQVVNFGTEWISKVFVSHITKTLNSAPTIEYCLRIGEQLNDGYAMVFKRPTPEQFISQIKEAFFLNTNDIFDILKDFGRSNSESFGIGIKEDLKNLSIKVLGSEGTTKDLLTIKLDSSNPEIIFNSNNSLVIDEINPAEFPDDLTINVYKFDAFYAGNFSLKDFSGDFDASASSLNKYISGLSLE